MKSSVGPARFARELFWMVFVFVCRAVIAAEEPIPKLLPPHGEISPTFWEKHGGQACIGVILILLVLGFLVILLNRPKRVIIEPPGVMARRLLGALRGRKPDASLAVQVSRILKNYVRAVFYFSSDELNTTEFCAMLKKDVDVDPALADDIGNYLRRCDEWKFASAPSAQTDIIAEALAFVEKIEIRRAKAEAVESASVT